MRRHLPNGPASSRLEGKEDIRDVRLRGDPVTRDRRSRSNFDAGVIVAKNRKRVLVGRIITDEDHRRSTKPVPENSDCASLVGITEYTFDDLLPGDDPCPGRLGNTGALAAAWPPHEARR